MVNPDAQSELNSDLSNVPTWVTKVLRITKKARQTAKCMNSLCVSGRVQNIDKNFRERARASWTPQVFTALVIRSITTKFRS